jgi:transposase
LTAERVRIVNRIKGLLFAQGVSSDAPLRRDRRAELEQLRTGDGCPLPPHLKQRIGREIDRLELLLEHIKEVKAERDDMLAAAKEGHSEPGDDATARLAVAAASAGLGAQPMVPCADR